MKLPWTTRISLFFYRYITGPLTDGFVNLGQRIFIWLDKITGKEIPPISEEEELLEHRRQTNLKKDNVPEELQHLVSLAAMWGIGDDAIRGDIVAAATDEDKQTLIAAMDGKLVFVDKWLESFAEGSMTDEAAAFMYLAAAIEELGLDVRYE